ncbi:sialate O-acetylesterase [Calycomorphotria hydatis]|nr:sialate O-acetylesterase [Calycomorphotria hydatis]
MPAIFGDHMVLQQGQDLPVWGWAKPGAKVAVEINGQQGETVTNNQGRWKVSLAPLKTVSEPTRLVITSGADNIQFDDVLIGEVWLCSGQSNMGLGIGKADGGPETVDRATDTRLRLFRVKQHPAYSSRNDVEGEWIVGTPENVLPKINGRIRSGGFSAVGYFFGRHLQDQLDCPVGLIGSYVGGTPVEAWTSEDALEASLDVLGRRSQTSRRLHSFRQARQQLPEAMQQHAQKLLQWEEELAARNEAHRVALEQFKLASQLARESNLPLPQRPLIGKVSRRPLEPDRYPSHCSVLFEGMIKPLIPYGIKGAIWYQGEANAYPNLATEYRTTFPVMITDWRERWGQGDFPFLFVQLPNYETSKDNWSTLRDSQRHALETPNTGMAVTIDVGDPHDLHPTNKKPIADRLALEARRIVYGENLVSRGPMIQSCEMTNEGNVRLTFDDLGDGLMTGKITEGYLASESTTPLGGFEVAGKDGIYFPAEAHIEGETVVLHPKSGNMTVQSVRYAWAPNPQPQANLYNRNGLPASPFEVSVSTNTNNS